LGFRSASPASLETSRSEILTRVIANGGGFPIGRPTECRPSPEARIVGLPRVGGLHHRYEWREAA
jgi:hypothetical protein